MKGGGEFMEKGLTRAPWEFAEVLGKIEDLPGWRAGDVGQLNFNPRR